MSMEARGRGPAPVPIDSNKALECLARLATEFTAMLSLPDLLEQALRVLREGTGFDACLISLLERRENDDVLVVRVASGLRERQGARGTIFRRGTGLAWDVLNSGMPVLVSDLHAHPRMVRKDPNLRSGIYAPLVVHHRPIGVLIAYRSAVNAFAISDLNLLTVVARYVAGAIEVDRLHEQLKEMVATDAITGLANRRTFLDRLSAELDRSRRSRRVLSVALVDLDGFKEVNDTWGHAAGDEALAQFAEALAHSVRTYDLAVRLEADEFALLLPESPRAKAEEILTRLRDAAILRPPHTGAGSRLAFSWGVAVFPDDGENIDELLHAAESRLDAMKPLASP